MFRALRGYKAQYHYLTLLIASDFDEWKIILEGPGVTIHGGRQFTEGKAKEQALAVARDYIHQEKHDDLPPVESLEWKPFDPGEWMNWRP